MEFWYRWNMYFHHCIIIRNKRFTSCINMLTIRNTRCIFMLHVELKVGKEIMIFMATPIRTEIKSHGKLWIQSSRMYFVLYIPSWKGKMLAILVKGLGGSRSVTQSIVLLTLGTNSSFLWCHLEYYSITWLYGQQPSILKPKLIENRTYFSNVKAIYNIRRKHYKIGSKEILISTMRHELSPLRIGYYSLCSKR